MRKDGDLSSANDRIQRMEDEMRQMANQISLLDAEKNKLQTQLQESLPEIQSLRDKLNEAKRNLDEEQIKSADLENTCARLEEDLKFKLQLLEKELLEEDLKFKLQLLE